MNPATLAAIEAALQAPAQRADLAAEFLAGRGRRYVIGRNNDAAAALALCGAEGVIDDYATGVSAWHDVPVVRLADVPQDAIVLNCSTSISPVAVLDRLTQAGIKRVLNFADLVIAADGALDWPWFVRDQLADFAAHRDEWLNLFAQLADEASRQTLLDVLRFRLSAQPAYMQGYSVRLRDQYFEDFMPLNDEVFVDAGGFDGDTTEEFCRRVPGYRQVVLFEPSAKNMQAARTRLHGHANIDFIEMGLSDTAGALHFDSDAGSASSVSDAGAETIRVTTLDESVRMPVSFIKMDLEGWEMQALAGARRHITEDHPKLALAVYHAAADFRRIPAFVRSLHADYRVYLRHYTQGWSETVMYFVPLRTDDSRRNA